MLIIEKVIKLLDDFHYQAFREYIKNMSKRSFYPLALVDVIDRDITVSQKIEDLIFQVYGEHDEKTYRKFIQLAHYTFKLCSFLANNYPHFLTHNLSKFQYYINTGALHKANILADILFEISRKIEDLPTEIQLLKMQAQQNALIGSAYYSLKLSKRINRLIGYEHDQNQLMNYIFEHFNTKTKTNATDLKQHLDFFQKYHGHECKAIQLISRYYSCFSYYYVKDEQFYELTILEKLEDLSADFQRYSFLILPYLNDYQHNIAFLKINHRLQYYNKEEVVKYANEILKEGERRSYWKSFINLPELNSLVFQVDYYTKKYMRGYRNDEDYFYPDDVSSNLQLLKKTCEEFLMNELLEQMFIIQYIRLNTTYAQILNCGNQADQQQAIITLENILMSYQQFSFHDWLDPIYRELCVAHFNLTQYQRVEDIYKRYRKVFTSRVSNVENKLTITAIYYISKWLLTNRDQYRKKLKPILQQLDKPNLILSKRLIEDILGHYKLKI